MPVENQVAILYAVTNGYLDEVPLEKIKEFEDRFHIYLAANAKELLNTIRVKKEMDESSEEKLKRLIAEFKTTFHA